MPPTPEQDPVGILKFGPHIIKKLYYAVKKKLITSLTGVFWGHLVYILDGHSNQLREV